MFYPLDFSHVDFTLIKGSNDFFSYLEDFCLSDHSLIIFQALNSCAESLENIFDIAKRNQLLMDEKKETKHAENIQKKHLVEKKDALMEISTVKDHLHKIIKETKLNIFRGPKDIIGDGITLYNKKIIIREDLILDIEQNGFSRKSKTQLLIILVHEYCHYKLAFYSFSNYLQKTPKKFAEESGNHYEKEIFGGKIFIDMISDQMPYAESFEKIYHKSAQFYASKKEESKEDDQGLKNRKRKKMESERFAFF